MPILVSLADVRDVFIILYGVVGVLFFLIAIAISVALFMTVKSLLKSVNQMLEDDVKPAVASVREAADTVRGTTEYVGRTAVQPIARVYGAASGVRRGISVLANLRRGGRGA